jgi:hypothetical protein
MTASNLLKELESLGDERTRKTLMRHGAREPLFGVKIAELQKIRKRIKTDHELALELYDSGNYDAMYLAGLIADDARMTKTQLRKWTRGAYGGSLSGATVPWVATGSPHGCDLALEWIDSPKEHIASIGWSTLASIVSVWPDEELSIPVLRKLLQRTIKEIHKAPGDVRYAMNGFLIAIGSCVVPLSETALKTAEAIGEVYVDHGDTSCRTPFAPDYIRKVEAMGRIGRKKKTAKC